MHTVQYRAEEQVMGVHRSMDTYKLVARTYRRLGVFGRPAVI
jgi:hypothetical protein